MSAESPHKSSSRGGHIVAPQPISDRSIIESVAGFINEVVPQAYTSLPPSESKECITWARFEYGDINDPSLYPDTSDDHTSTPPLLLVLGYGNGVQVWAVPANGEASEVLSWRQGVVRTLRVLPTPLADSPIPDTYSHKRPLVALCDSAGPGPQFCSLSFISLRAGDQVKNIKFKNPVSDVLANRRSVVVTFPERIAVFDACTLEDRLTVTTCYPCPGPNPNPVALGTRWLAYSERRLLAARRSSGGMEGEGVQSYTATVLHAAKSLGKGLRELGETVASSLTGGVSTAGMQRGPGGGMANQQGGTCDSQQPGIVTILDAQGVSSSHAEEPGPAVSNADVMLAHFVAHSEPIVALAFDPSGMLLLTADRRGHDFHLFRIHSHPGGPSLAAVHHLYILHRGDTTAKVQDIAFAADSRWVAVSTLRGTTHVFPITPYGGPVGIRTHTTPHVVNRLSRFHRSAGLTADGRNSPVPTVCPVSTASTYEAAVVSSPAMSYPNPRLPPYPHPTVIAPLAQIRQPIAHTLQVSVVPMSPNASSPQLYHRNPPTRLLGRSQSMSDEGMPGGGVPLRMAACFAPPRAWLVGSPTVPRESSSKIHKRAVDSLFVMACHGSLIEYDLEPRHASGIPKEKLCDDTPIELEVQARAQWLLLRPPHSSELQPPLPATNPLMLLPEHIPPNNDSKQDDADERWLSQVEIVTHAGPHRRLWMGPQFMFKTYTATSGSAPYSLLEMEAVEVGIGAGSRPARSNPVNMPLTGGGRPIVPVLIESGSASSYEQSPRLMEVYGGDGGDSDGSAGPGDTQLREDLADAMMESPGVPIRDTGRRVFVARSLNPIEKVVNPVGTVVTVAVPLDEEMSPAASCREPPADGMVRWPTTVKLLEDNKECSAVTAPNNGMLKEEKCNRKKRIKPDAQQQQHVELRNGNNRRAKLGGDTKDVDDKEGRLAAESVAKEEEQFEVEPEYCVLKQRDSNWSKAERKGWKSGSPKEAVGNAEKKHLSERVETELENFVLSVSDRKEEEHKKTDVRKNKSRYTIQMHDEKQASSNETQTEQVDTDSCEKEEEEEEERKAQSSNTEIEFGSKTDTSDSTGITFSTKKVEVLPPKTWSSIVSPPEPKVNHKLWSELAATGLNPKVLNSSLDQEESNGELNTELEEYKGMENNNEEEAVPTVRSWSSIVVGAGCSTESPDLGEEEVSGEPANLSSSVKKSRRAKKKRR